MLEQYKTLDKVFTSMQENTLLIFLPYLKWTWAKTLLCLFNRKKNHTNESFLSEIKNAVKRKEIDTQDLIYIMELIRGEEVKVNIEKTDRTG